MKYFVFSYYHLWSTTIFLQLQILFHFFLTKCFYDAPVLFLIFPLHLSTSTTNADIECRGESIPQNWKR